MSGTILYQCTSCGSFINVDLQKATDEQVYIECDCNELALPVESPADVIIDLQNFILKTAWPALALAQTDYPQSLGPRTNLTDLESLREKYKF